MSANKIRGYGGLGGGTFGNAGMSYLVVGGIAFFLCILALVLAPFIIDKADNDLAVLRKSGSLKPKGYPFSLHRMADYGLVIIFKNSGFVNRKVFEGRPDRIKALNDCHPWIKILMVFVYASFLISAVFSFLLAGLLIAVNKLFGS